jgi:hypothetical protein
VWKSEKRRGIEYRAARYIWKEKKGKSKVLSHSSQTGSDMTHHREK